MSASSEDYEPVVSRDRRNFTEGEFKRELELHSVKLEKGQSAGQIYRKQPQSVFENPRSGVFRDFVQYQVHPARVTIQKFRLTIPFILEFLNAKELDMEIANQKEKKLEDSKISYPTTLLPSGEVRQFPTADKAFELIQVIQKNKSHLDWTPAMQINLSAFNFWTFSGGETNRNLVKFFTPSRDRAVTELTPLISTEIALKEIKNQITRDPSRWGRQAPEKISSYDVAALVADLITNEVYTTGMREIFRWYIYEFKQTQFIVLVKTILERQESLIAKVRTRTS